MLVRLVKSTNQIGIEKYLATCEQLNVEPDPERMPLSRSRFPEQVQVAFFIHDQLTDIYIGMNAQYGGKDWNQCKFLFDLYQVDEQKVILYFMHMYDNILVGHRAEEANNRMKEAERKAKSSSGGGQKHP